MKRFRTGWELTKKSSRLLRRRPRLVAYPFVGGLLAALAFVVLAGAGLYLVDTGVSALGWVLVAAGTYLAALLSTFYCVALVVAAERDFAGEKIRFGAAVAVARGRLGAIAGWTLMSVVVGGVLSLIDGLRGAGGTLLSALGGIAWGLITFLALPVIVLERRGPVGALRRSAALFRERWRGQLVGDVAIGGGAIIVGVLPSLVLTVLGVVLWIGDGNGDSVALGAVLLLIGIAGLCVSLVVLQTLRNIFGVALYRYAAAGELVGGFTEEELGFAVGRHGDPATDA